MIKRISLALVVLLVGILAGALSRPSTYHVERSTSVAAPVEIPFGLVNDFHRWHFWSPWEGEGPKVRRAYDGTYAGTGAIYTWSGNEQVGKARMVLLDTQLNDSIRIQLERERPWASSGLLTFTFHKDTRGVALRAELEGRHSLMGRLFALFSNWEERLGEDLDKGLAQLKTLSEAEVQNRRERDVRIKARDEAESKAPATP